MLRTLTIIMALFLLVSVSAVSAENYVNWKGGFWLELPDEWEKVDYNVVDRILAVSDTARDAFMYEAVFAPLSSPTFISGPYLVITFDETGELSDKEAIEFLQSMASSFAQDVSEAPSVEKLSDLSPGIPTLNRKDKSVSVLTEMAFKSDAKTQLWMYMKLNSKGLMTLYMYCPDSIYNETKPVFEKMVSSLSFDKLKEAAGTEDAKFTDVRGGVKPASSGGVICTDEDNGAQCILAFKNWIFVGVGIVIVAGLIWNFVIIPRRKKKKDSSE